MKRERYSTIPKTERHDKSRDDSRESLRVIVKRIRELFQQTTGKDVPDSVQELEEVILIWAKERNLEIWDPYDTEVDEQINDINEQKRRTTARLNKKIEERDLLEKERGTDKGDKDKIGKLSREIRNITRKITRLDGYATEDKFLMQRIAQKLEDISLSCKRSWELSSDKLDSYIISRIAELYLISFDNGFLRNKSNEIFQEKFVSTCYEAEVQDDLFEGIDSVRVHQISLSSGDSEDEDNLVKIRESTDYSISPFQLQTKLLRWQREFVSGKKPKYSHIGHYGIRKDQDEMLVSSLIPITHEDISHLDACHPRAKKKKKNPDNCMIGNEAHHINVNELEQAVMMITRYKQGYLLQKHWIESQLDVSKKDIKKYLGFLDALIKQSDHQISKIRDFLKGSLEITDESGEIKQKKVMLMIHAARKKRLLTSVDQALSLDEDNFDSIAQDPAMKKFYEFTVKNPTAHQDIHF